MNRICSDYIKVINDDFKDEVKGIIIYGSNIYNENLSDLDVCVIINNYDEALKRKIIKKTIQFHKDYGLKRDEEVPFNNKLVYTISEIEDTLSNPPFYVGGKVIINDIIKTKEFLSSKEMKQRLMLNMLTTDHLTVGIDTTEYENRAFKIIIDVIKKYYCITDNSESEILECMYKNKYTNAQGEMYLGYKKKYRAKDDYLRKKIHEVLKETI